MSYFLVVIAVLVVGAVAVYVVGLNRPPKGHGRALLEDGFTDPVPNLPPVLLPAEPSAKDVDRLRFSLGLRGYRMDQVDEVLDVLRDRIGAQEARIEQLEALLASRGSTATTPASGAGPE